MEQTTTQRIPLVYGEGLGAKYGSYSTDIRRARAQNDIVLRPGEILRFIIQDTNYHVALAAWDSETKQNKLYGGWDINLLYPNEYDYDLLLKFVIKKQDDSAFGYDSIPEGAVLAKIYYTPKKVYSI